MHPGQDQRQLSHRLVYKERRGKNRWVGAAGALDGTLQQVRLPLHQSAKLQVPVLCCTSMCCSWLCLCAVGQGRTCSHRASIIMCSNALLRKLHTDLCCDCCRVVAKHSACNKTDLGCLQAMTQTTEEQQDQVAAASSAKLMMKQELSAVCQPDAAAPP